MAAPETALARRLDEVAGAAAARGDWAACGAASRRLLLLTASSTVHEYYCSFSARIAGDDRGAAIFARRALRSLGQRRILPFHRELFALSGATGDRTGDLRRAVIVTPEDPGGLFNLGNALDREGESGAALRSFGRAEILRPLDHETLGNIARIRGLVETRADAEQDFRRALIVAPADFVSLRNLALYFRGRAARASAITWFRCALAINPTSRAVHGELGRALLVDGQVREGWALIERFRLPEWEAPFDLPRWDGGPVQDGALLVWSMDQIGDELFFSTFLQRARRRAGRIVLIAHHRNRTLLQKLHPEICVLDALPECWGDDPGWRPRAACPFDFIGRSFVDTPADLPDPEGDRRLPAQTRTSGALQVGISWKSEAALIGSVKSTRLADWRDILDIEGCDFYSLQYAEMEEERAAHPQIRSIPGFDPVGDSLDFAETVATLDLIISVGNTTTHIAARTETPLWVLLPRGFGHNWIWLGEGCTTPAYQKARIFRQRHPGDWAPVLADVRAELARLAGADTNPDAAR